MKGVGWWIGMAITAALTFYGTNILLPFK